MGVVGFHSLILWHKVAFLSVQPRDQLLSVNGVNVRDTDKALVVEMIRKASTVLKLEVSQPTKKVLDYILCV
jgi:hypothetical protein